MPEALKDQNIPRLLAIMTGNVALYLVFLPAGPFADASYGQIAKYVAQFAPAALTIALLTIVNGLLGPLAKARLVFWRWTDPLPGSRAFSVHAKHDPRINLQALKQKVGKWPKNAREQNSIWYGLYRTVQSDPSVSSGHREFLFARDYAGLSAVFLLFLGALATYQFHDVRRLAAYVAVLATQYLIVRYVAAKYGERFVTTVLALKSAEQ